MKTIRLILLLGLLIPVFLPAQEIRKNVPLDSILLSDPFIQADPETGCYYMTGTGGMLWKSRDLKY